MGLPGLSLQVPPVLAAALSALLFPDHYKVSSSVPPHTRCHEVLPNRKGAS